MINVEIRSVGSGICSWCGKEKSEVCTVVFKDDGPQDYCQGDFWRAVRSKARSSAKKLDRSTHASNGDA
jgi:hypothetical protein